MGEPAVFLDRDGVINPYVYNPEFGTVDSPSNPDEFQLNPGVREAIDALRAMGFLIIVVSNQPGIAKGKFTPGLLDATTTKMLEGCGGKIDDVYYCLHHPQATNVQYMAECVCRKPKPGLLLQAAAEWEIDLTASFMVGDGLTDVLAGKAAGARTILVNSRKCYLCGEIEKNDAEPEFFATSLANAVEMIRAQQNLHPWLYGAPNHELYGNLHPGSRCDS